jgi:hypothetical protein
LVKQASVHQGEGKKPVSSENHAGLKKREAFLNKNPCLVGTSSERRTMIYSSRERGVSSLDAIDGRVTVHASAAEKEALEAHDPYQGDHRLAKDVSTRCICSHATEARELREHFQRRRGLNVY